MKSFKLILLIFAFTGCGINISVEEFVPEIKTPPTPEESTPDVPCSSDNYNLLVPKIQVLSISQDTDTPYTIDFIDNSFSSGTIVSRTWTITNLRDEVASPANLGCGGSDCRYSGSDSLTGSDPTFSLSDVGTPSDPNGGDDHDDFIITLEVEDSNGLTATTKAMYISFSPALFGGNETKIFTTPKIGDITKNLCQLSFSVDSETFRNDLGSGVNDLSIDFDSDYAYETTITDPAQVLPQNISHDLELPGVYLSRIVLASDGFAPGGQDPYEFYFTEFAISIPE